MNRGTLRLAWIVAVCALAAVPVACSGFSSEETQASAADGGEDAAGDSMSVNDALPLEGGAVVDSGADAATFCSGSKDFCTDFSSNDPASWHFEKSAVADGGTLEWRSEDSNGFLFAKGVYAADTLETTPVLSPKLKFRIRFDAKIEKSAVVNGSIFAKIRMSAQGGEVSALLEGYGSKFVVYYSGAGLTSETSVPTSVFDSWVTFEIFVDLTSANPVVGTLRERDGSVTAFSGKSGIPLSNPTGMALSIGHIGLANVAQGSVSFDNVRIDAL